MSNYKFYPASFPKPLQTGYSSKHRPNMLRTSMSDGYVRQRLVNQGAPDTLSIQIMMNEHQYKEFVAWYKSDIQCGASWFVMPLLAVDAENSIQYRYVRIQNGEFTASVVTTNPNDGTIYRLNMTLDASNTAVDDGSWQDHYDTNNGGDVIVPLQQVADAIGVDGNVDDVVSGFTRINEE